MLVKWRRYDEQKHESLMLPIMSRSHGIAYRSSKQSLAVWMKYWVLVLPAAVLATLPWLNQLPVRFSLRTMLIVTALVAVVLGLIAWVRR